MKISWPKAKKYNLAQQRKFKKLAEYCMSHYPKDSDLHKAVKGCFGAFEQWSRTHAKAATKSRKTARRRTTAKRRPTARRRTTAKRRAPARRKTARRRPTVRRRTGMRRRSRRAA